jgi:hypothetical protein
MREVRPMKTFIAVAALAVGVMVAWYVMGHKEVTSQRAIVAEVKGLIQDCRAAGDHVAFARKALVWNMHNDTRSGAYGMLPDPIRATDRDRPITVFMVVGERKEKVGTYSISGQPAYRQYVDVAVVLWPDKKPIGFHTVVSREPKLSRPVQDTAEYGDRDEAIANWIMSLRR